MLLAVPLCFIFKHDQQYNTINNNICIIHNLLQIIF